jgi:hypothetical protein
MQLGVFEMRLGGSAPSPLGGMIVSPIDIKVER